MTLPMQTTKRICIAYAEIKKNLHCNAKKKWIVHEKIKTICIAHAENKKNCLPNVKNKKELHCQCKKHKEFALPMQKLKRICISKILITMQHQCRICIRMQKIKNCIVHEKFKTICIA